MLAVARADLRCSRRVKGEGGDEGRKKGGKGGGRRLGEVKYKDGGGGRKQGK